MSIAPLRTLALPSGAAIPILGQGTWGMAEDASQRSNEINSLRTGLDLGLSLIDTAEMYADGGAEALVGQAIAGRREEVFLVSKVLPQHATKRGTLTTCDASLRRLGTDYLDLYLLHWRGAVPLQDTLEAFEILVAAGKIRHWGVSNFDTSDMADLAAFPQGCAVATNQVLYNLMRRGIEYDLLPWCRSQRLPIMAYSPVEQGRLLDHAILREVARTHQATPAQVALAWLIQQGVIVIPKAGTPGHVHDNHASLTLRLEDDDLAALDRTFPPPRESRPLEML